MFGGPFQHLWVVVNSDAWQITPTQDLTGDEVLTLYLGRVIKAASNLEGSYSNWCTMRSMALGGGPWISTTAGYLGIGGNNSSRDLKYLQPKLCFSEKNWALYGSLFMVGRVLVTATFHSNCLSFE